MIPRPGSTPRSGSAPVTKTLIGVSVLIYLMAVGYLGAQGASIGESVYEALAQKNRLVAAGEWWRLITPVLLHSTITFSHILFNMWALWVLGPRLEQSAGSGPFLALYLATAAAGGALAFHLGNIDDQAVGASGAIFGLFGVWLLSAYRSRHTGTGRAMLNQFGFLLLINAMIPLVFPQVSWQAHLGGLAGGVLIGQLWASVGAGQSAVRRILLAAAVGLVAVVSVLI